jgi:hypothetical protein
MPAAAPVRLEETPRPAEQPSPAPRQPAILPEKLDPTAPAPSKPAILPDHPDPTAPAPKRPAITPNDPLDQPPPEHPPENPRAGRACMVGCRGVQGRAIRDPAASPAQVTPWSVSWSSIPGAGRQRPCRDREDSHG